MLILNLKIFSWQDGCIEIREAAQALLVRELARLGGDGRRRLIESWAPFLPPLLDESLSIFGKAIICCQKSRYFINNRYHFATIREAPFTKISYHFRRSNAIECPIRTALRSSTPNPTPIKSIAALDRTSYGSGPTYFRGWRIRRSASTKKSSHGDHPVGSCRS